MFCVCIKSAEEWLHFFSFFTCLSWAGRGSPSCTQRQSKGGRSLWSPPLVSPRWHGSTSSGTATQENYSQVTGNCYLILRIMWLRQSTSTRPQLMLHSAIASYLHFSQVHALFPWVKLPLHPTQHRGHDEDRAESTNITLSGSCLYQMSLGLLINNTKPRASDFSLFLSFHREHSRHWVCNLRTCYSCKTALITQWQVSLSSRNTDSHDQPVHGGRFRLKMNEWNYIMWC